MAQKCNTTNSSKSIVTVQKWEDVKKVEQFEDCFILEFDPSKIINVSNTNHDHHDDHDGDGDDDDDDDDDEISECIVCVKKREDVKKFEEFEDCFILDFNPFEEDEEKNHLIGVKFSQMCVSVKTEVVSDDDDDDDVCILAVKGQVACRDYPHPRHACATHPFQKTPHETHCKMCYCYVCDISAPCKKWTEGCKDPSLKHCDATPDVSHWRSRRDRKKQRSEGG
ncbi:hypothetical protein vseg_001073 [Gypsophila vaccaria]